MIYFDKEKQTNLIQQAELIRDCGNNGKRKKSKKHFCLVSRAQHRQQIGNELAA